MLCWQRFSNTDEPFHFTPTLDGLHYMQHFTSILCSLSPIPAALRKRYTSQIVALKYIAKHGKLTLPALPTRD